MRVRRVTRRASPADATGVREDSTKIRARASRSPAMKSASDSGIASIATADRATRRAGAIRAIAGSLDLATARRAPRARSRRGNRSDPGLPASPTGRRESKRPWTPRAGDSPRGTDRPRDDRPQDRPQADRPPGDRPQSDRPRDHRRPEDRDKSRGWKPDRPQGQGGGTKREWNRSGPPRGPGGHRSGEGTKGGGFRGGGGSKGPGGFRGGGGSNRGPEGNRSSGGYRGGGANRGGRGKPGGGGRKGGGGGPSR